jgi:hypothetical protein
MNPNAKEFKFNPTAITFEPKSIVQPPDSTPIISANISDIKPAVPIIEGNNLIKYDIN